MTGPFDQLAAALAAGPTVRTISLDRTPRGERSAAVLMLLTEAADPEVTFVVATWRGDGELWPADPAETGAVHQFAVSALAAPGTRVTAQHPLGFRGPAFVLDDTFIWGLTAHLVDWVLDLAGWARPWDKSRVVDIPERFLRD